jgi:hypothetical protein
MTMLNEPATVRPQAKAPSVGWVLRRIAFGLLAMAAFTTLGAYLAYVSIETAAEPAPGPGIEIGTPAAGILAR